MDQLVKILDDIESSKWPTAEYEVMLTGVTVNNTKFSQLSLFVSYDAGGSLRLSCADEAAIKNALEHDGDLKLTASNLQGTAKLWSRFVPSDYYDGFSLDLVAEAGSVSLLNGTTLDRIEATVVNGPLLFKKNIIDFEAGEFNLSYRQFKNITNEKMSKAGRVKTNIATGRVVLSRVDGGEICLNEANEKLEEFRRFLTMVRGRYCGLGNSFFYSGTNMVGAKLGFTKVDSLVLLEGWYDWDLDHQLSDIFIRYSSATAEEAKSEVLYLAVEFYRSANAVRSTSSELAIVASFTCLEVLVPFVLSEYAGWSTNLMSQKNVPFSDKLSAALSRIDLVGNPFEHLTKLQQRSAAENDRSAPEIIALFRNRIVHQGKNFEYSGSELLEVWNLSQWICELLIFFIIGYGGEMYDRRKYTGFHGPPVKMPIARII